MLTNKNALEFLRLLLDQPGARIISSNDLSAEEIALWQGACDRHFYVDDAGYGFALVPKRYVLAKDRAGLDNIKKPGDGHVQHQ